MKPKADLNQGWSRGFLWVSLWMEKCDRRPRTGSTMESWKLWCKKLKYSIHGKNSSTWQDVASLCKSYAFTQWFPQLRSRNSFDSLYFCAKRCHATHPDALRVCCSDCHGLLSDLKTAHVTLPVSHSWIRYVTGPSSAHDLAKPVPLRFAWCSWVTIAPVSHCFHSCWLSIYPIKIPLEVGF